MAATVVAMLFFYRVVGRNGGGFGRGCSIGRFANFQCQIGLKYGHPANVFHFRTDEFSTP